MVHDRAGERIQTRHAIAVDWARWHSASGEVAQSQADILPDANPGGQVDFDGLKLVSFAPKTAD